MEEIIKAMCQMRDEMREIKALLLNHLKITRSALLKEQWLDAQEVSRIFHISPRKLRTLQTNGQLSYSMIDDKQFFKYGDVDKLLESKYIKNHPIKKS